MTLADLVRDPKAIAVVPAERVPVLLREASALVMLLAAHLPEPVTPEPERPAAEKWLTAAEVAAIAGLSVRQVRSLSRRTDWRSFTRRLNGRTTRYSEAGVQQWLSRGFAR